MPKNVRKEINFTHESLRDLLQNDYDKLEIIRQKAERDYNRINQLQKTASDYVVLDNAKNNSMKMLVSYFEKKNEILKMVKDVVLSKDKIENNKDTTNGEVNSQEEKLQFQKIFQEMSKNKRMKDNAE